jgi:hypothetical protein
MNKKGVIAIIVIIILVVIGYSIWGGSSTSVSNETGTNTPVVVPEGVTKETFAPVTKDTTNTTLIGRLKSASVSATESGNRAALSNGTAKFTEGSVKGTITLGDVATEKTVGGVKYVLAPITVDTGGSAYQYVVLFEDKNGSLTDKSYSVIGTNAKVTGIRADEVSDASGKPQLVVSISYTQSGASRTKLLVVENGIFNPAKEINL